uniref:CD28 molecule n=2 Tax=Meleagris gallopavo TaxID=9103 RepID=G3UTA0_MELGA
MAFMKRGVYFYYLHYCPAIFPQPGFVYDRILQQWLCRSATLICSATCPSVHVMRDKLMPSCATPGVPILVVLWPYMWQGRHLNMQHRRLPIDIALAPVDMVFQPKHMTSNGAADTCHLTAENKILVAQSPLLIVANRTATLVCNYTYNGTGKEFRASLHKGTDSSVEVCFISWNMTKSNSNSNKEFNCWGNHDKDKVIFNLRNMTASQTDIYFCKIEAMYPPPYVYNEKSNGTVIHVRETPIQTQEPESATSYWVMVALTGLLGFYSMLVTAVFIIYRQKSKRNRYRQSDYMNMTPRHPPHQKNKGYPSYAPTRDYTAYRSWQP